MKEYFIEVDGLKGSYTEEARANAESRGIDLEAEIRSALCRESEMTKLARAKMVELGVENLSMEQTDELYKNNPPVSKEI